MNENQNNQNGSGVGPLGAQAFNPNSIPQGVGPLGAMPYDPNQNLTALSENTHLKQQTFSQGQGGLKGVAIGVAKGDLQATQGLASFGQTILGGIGKGVDFLTGGRTKLGQTYAPGTEGYQATHENPDGKLDPVGTAEGLGHGLEKSGEFLAQLAAAPEVAVEKMGMSGLTALAEKGALSPETLATAQKAITSKWGIKAFELLNDFVTGAGFKGAQNMASGEEGGKVKAGLEVAAGGQVLRGVPKLFSALKGKFTGESEAQGLLRERQALEKKNLTDNQNLKLEHGKKMDALQTEAESIQKDLGTASRDEALKLRAKAPKVLGEQSQEYRRLVDEAMAGKENTAIAGDELRDFITRKYAETPEVGQSIINKMGLQEGSQTTLGKLYQGSVSMGKDLRAVRQGARVFTPDEKLTDDTISTLVDFMKDRGVDLKAPREFWAKYAPVRNQLVRELRPFNQAGTQTSGFANRLVKIAQGKDPNNENYISTLEKLFGESIGKDTKAVVAKLNANEKQQLAAKMEAELKKMEMQLAQQQKTQALSTKEAELQRKAAIKRKIMGVLGTLGTFAVGYEAKNLIEKTTDYGL